MQFHNLLAAFLLSAPPAAATGPSSAEFFESKIRPVLVDACYQCHGNGKSKGGLRLDTRESLLKGGDSGKPAVAPGNANDSPLIQAVRRGGDLKMPPKEKLPDREIALLAKWVRGGAVWPVAPVAAKPAGEMLFDKEAKNFWAFKPPVEPPLPTVKNRAWSKSPLDLFVLRKLEEKGLKPAPPADRRTLLRRVTFDLTGLPPTPEEIDAFLNDKSPDAFATVVERLLASAAYGERWGRHWLDLARYADEFGGQDSWRYRDYVISAFNQDKRYDVFIAEQLAGDLMPTDDLPLWHARVIATGFLALGDKDYSEPRHEKLRMDIVDEQIDVVSKTFLGLTISCARCHDHKFDPIPTRDYYSLAGIFRSTLSLLNLDATAGFTQILEVPLVGKKELDAYAKEKRELVMYKNSITARKGSKNGPGTPMVLAVLENKIANARINIRGDATNLGAEVPRQFPRILAGDKQTPIGNSQSGRLELSRWLASPGNPLTARVMVNRIWQHHFGEGLVRTPDNFGKLGERPSHPELLDWLAITFRDKKGWSIKEMHRLILLSSAYQMSAAFQPEAAAVDPENRLLWRMNRRRLEVEAIRDSLLAVGGGLDRTMGGKVLGGKGSVQSKRRSIYLPVSRTRADDMFQMFDFVDSISQNGQRASTTVASQALFLMNSPTVLQQARGFAGQLLSKADLNDSQRIALAFTKAFARPPTAKETQRALEYLQDYASRLLAEKSDASQRRAAAWQSYCHVLVASNEFIYVD